MKLDLGPEAGIRQPSQETWPNAIIVAWHKAAQSRRGRLRSPATYKSYADSVATYLWFLKSKRLLDPEACLADQVTPERTDEYFDYLLHHGNAPHSILGRFGSLHAALRMMHPDGDFGFVTKPDGLPLRRLMEMRRRVLLVPDARHTVFWAEALFRDALTFPAALQRRLQVRDAAIIGIFAELGPRVRAMRSLSLRHLQRTSEEWILRQEGPIMKRQNTVLELPLSPRVGAILDRYIAVERRELLKGQNYDALWVAKNGNPLCQGVRSMVARRSRVRFGVSFGPQRFRTSLTTTRAMIAGGRSFDPSLILGHGPITSLRYYNRAGSAEALQAHDARISALED